MAPLPRKGALLTLGDLSDSQIEEYRLQYGTDKSNKQAIKINDFLEGLFSLCQADPENLTDMQSVTQALNISRGTVLARCSDLIGQGNMTKGFVDEEKGGSATIYTLTPFCSETPTQDQMDFGSLLDEPLKEIEGELLSSAAENTFFIDTDSGAWKADRFSTLSLLALFPGGTNTSLRKEGYETTIHIGPAKMLVRVKPIIGHLCPCVLDLRALSAVITIAARRIQTGAQTGNPFRYSLKEILQQLELPNESSRKIRLYESLKRFEFTRINVLRATKEFAEKFPEYSGLDCDIDEPIVFIDKIKTYSFTTSAGLTPEQIDITFDDELLASISSHKRNLLSLHSESMVERNPYAFRLYLWLRRAVQHRTRENSLKMAEDKLKRELEPNRAPVEFRRDMKTFLSRYAQQGRGYARYMGYCIQLLPGRIYIFWAAENDPLVGLNGYHTLKRHEAGECAETVI